MRDEVRNDPSKDLSNRPSRVASYNEAIEPDRWRDHSDFRRDDLDDTKPDRVIAESFDYWQDDWHRQNQNCHLVHERTQDDVTAENERYDQQRWNVNAWTHSTKFCASWVRAKA